MLTILPEKNPAVFQPILERCAADGQEPAVLTAKEGGKQVGQVVVDCKHYSLRILELTLMGKEDLTDLSVLDKQLVDSLIKAAASYALNRNVFTMKSAYTPAFPLYQQFGFQQCDGIFRMDLSRLLKNCTNC